MYLQNITIWLEAALLRKLLHVITIPVGVVRVDLFDRHRCCCTDHVVRVDVIELFVLVVVRVDLEGVVGRVRFVVRVGVVDLEGVVDLVSVVRVVLAGRFVSFRVW